MNKRSRTHLVIPDCQVRPGVPLDHLKWIGNYIAEKRPDVIVCLGDFADMASLNGYSIGHASMEGKRYADDIQTTKEAMASLCRPFQALRNYRPAMHLTLGNHEDRISREADANPRFAATISIDDLGYSDFGWTSHPFLKVLKIDGIEYSHYFTSGVMGRPVSSAAALLRERQSSATMGHVQKLDFAVHPKTQRVGLFAGICYLHDEPYLTPQGQDTKRQIIMKHEVHDGVYDPMFVSLEYLKRKYS